MCRHGTKLFHEKKTKMRIWRAFFNGKKEAIGSDASVLCLVAMATTPHRDSPSAFEFFGTI
jgi:hypothetical protein